MSHNQVSRWIGVGIAEPCVLLAVREMGCLIMVGRVDGCTDSFVFGGRGSSEIMGLVIVWETDQRLVGM